MIAKLPAFRALVERAAGEAWPFWRLVDELELLPPEERELARIVMIGEIAAELDRKRPTWRERAPAASLPETVN